MTPGLWFSVIVGGGTVLAIYVAMINLEVKDYKWRKAREERLRENK